MKILNNKDKEETPRKRSLLHWRTNEKGSLLDGFDGKSLNAARKINFCQHSTSKCSILEKVFLKLLKHTRTHTIRIFIKKNRANYQLAFM